MPQKKPDTFINENKPSSPLAFRFWPLLILLVLILCVGIAFVLGVFIGRKESVSKNSPSPVATCPTSAQPVANGKDKGYQEGYQAALKIARQKVASLIPGMNAETHVLSGPIKSLQDKNIVVTLDASQVDIFGEGKLDKTFVVGPDTSIEQRVDKTAEQFNLELKKYNADTETFRKNQGRKDFDLSKNPFPSFPASFTLNKITLSTLKAGDLVKLITKSDLGSADPFDAVSVLLVPHAAESANPILSAPTTPSDIAPQVPVGVTPQPPVPLPRP